MNEIIKALFIKAGGGVEEENGNLWTYSDDLDPKEFAELIVKECMKVSNLSLSKHELPSDKIAEHFGVKQ